MAVTGIELVKLRPLSSAQSSIWFAQMLDSHSPVYNIGEYLEIVGPIDPQFFETALRQVVAECDALRLRVVETNEGPRQYIGTDPDWSMPFFDVSGEADPCAFAETWMHEDMARVVDLTRGPLFGYALFRAATNRFFWYARYHHICNDGFGFSLVARRLAAAYSTLVGDKPLETGNYGSWFDLLDEEDDYRLSARYVHDREYWHNQLAQRPEPVTFSGKPPARSGSFIRCIDHLTRPVVDALRAFGAAHEASGTGSYGRYRAIPAPTHRCV
jgi:nonribosomal peptide synthetase DhbF